MQKTKLGIPVGLLAAGIFHRTVGGYLVAVLLTRCPGKVYMLGRG